MTGATSDFIFNIYLLNTGLLSSVLIFTEQIGAAITVRRSMSGAFTDCAAVGSGTSDGRRILEFDCTGKAHYL